MKLNSLITTLYFSIGSVLLIGQNQIDPLDEKILIESLIHESIYDSVGYNIPSFELFTLEGEWITEDSLTHDYTILFFWNWSCQPCLDLFPIMRKLHEQFNHNTNFIGITSGHIVISEDYLDFYKLPFPVATNAKPYIKMLDIKAVPKLLILGPKLDLLRIIDRKFWGEYELRYEDFEIALNQVLPK